jgi:uroporphyrinogen decarboxylase
MAGKRMSSCERVDRMFARREQDRIPRHDSFWRETITRWQGEGLDGDAERVLELLGSDFGSLCWAWPVAFPGEPKLIGEDEQTRVLRDGQGKTVRYWKNRSGTPEHIGFECVSREAWEKIFKPALLSCPVQVDLAKAKQQHVRHRAAGKWVHLTGVEPFEETRSLMGDEVTMIAMVEDPEWVIDVARTFTDVVLENYEAVLANGCNADGLWIYGDMAYNHATVCSPGMYRELIWPQHKRMAQWAHERGMKVIFHTDGDVNAVIDLYIDAGFDCLQPLEAKARMDVRSLCPRYGDRIAFFGNVDVMILMSNDLARIEAEIASKLAAGKATHGYVYHSDHSVPPQVSWQTYQRIIKLVHRYGEYR